MNKTTAGQWKGYLLSILVLLIVGLAVAIFIGLSLIGAGWAWIVRILFIQLFAATDGLFWVRNLYLSGSPAITFEMR